MPDRFGESDEPDPEPPDPVSDVVWAAEQRRQAILACDLCDQDGYQGTLVCPHEDFRPAAERGRQLVNEALEQVRQRKDAGA